jgi:DNA repair exonuclease SbcCD nuclease subunit
MRISIIGDVHCGFAWGEERGDDSFRALNEAIEASRDSDLIILVGDLFDTRLPKQEVFAQVAKIIAQAQTFPNKTRLLESRGKDVNPLALRGVPVIALHGNHDRRSMNLVNPVQALEHAGLLTHLNAATLLFDCSGTRVAIHGMSNVPERYAKEALMSWAPHPVPNALNVLVMHQSIDPYVYSPLEPPSIKLEDMPEGFSLLIDGHMHSHDRRLLKGATFLLTGSISPTGVSRFEADQRKVFWQWDGSQLAPVPLSSQRRIFCEEFEWSPGVKQQMDDRFAQLLSTQLTTKPIIAAKVRGKLPPGTPQPNFTDLAAKWGERAVIQISKSLTSEDFDAQVELLRALRDNRLSPEESGLRLLMDNLNQANCSIRADTIFDLLVDGQVDTIFNELAIGPAQNSMLTEGRPSAPDGERVSP